MTVSNRRGWIMIMIGVSKMNKSDIDYIIEKLDSYKPDNIYDGCNSEREKRDQRVSEVLDSIIAEIKIEPVEESKWIKCSEKMPENGKNVLVVIKEDGYTDICVGETNKSGDWMINGEFWYEKSDPAITHWMLLPKPPEVEQ